MKLFAVLLVALLAALSSAAFPDIWTAGTPLLYLTPGGNVTGFVNNSVFETSVSMVAAMLPPFTTRATFYFTQGDTGSDADLEATMGAGFYPATDGSFYTDYSDFSSTTSSSPNFDWAISGDVPTSYGIFFTSASPVNLYFAVSPYYSSGAGNYTAVWQDFEFLRQYNGTSVSLDFDDSSYQICYNTSLGVGVRSVNLTSPSAWYVYSASVNELSLLTYDISSNDYYALPAPGAFVISCARAFSSTTTGDFSITVDTRCAPGSVWWRDNCTAAEPMAVPVTGATVMFNSTEDAPMGYKVWMLTFPASIFASELNITCDGCGGFEEFYLSTFPGAMVDPQLSNEFYIYSSGSTRQVTGQENAVYYFAWEQYYSGESVFNLTMTLQCLNGCAGQGQCVQGQCLCNAGRFGPDCGVQIAPVVPATAVTLTTVSSSDALVFQFNQTAASAVVYCNITSSTSFTTFIYNVNITTQQPLGVVAYTSSSNGGEATFYVPFVTQGTYAIVLFPGVSATAVTTTCTFPANPVTPGGESSTGSGESSSASAIGFSVALLVAFVAMLL